MKKICEDVLLKILVCGESRVGKSLMCQLLTSTDVNISDIFNDKTGVIGYSSKAYEPTIGLDMAVVKRQLSKNTLAKIHLWDTSGDIRYRGIVRSYFKACCATILVIDMSNEESSSLIKGWIAELRSQERADNQVLIISVFANIENGVHVKNNGISKECQKENVYFNAIRLTKDENIEESFMSLLSIIYTSYVSNGVRVHGIRYENEKENINNKNGNYDSKSEPLLNNTNNDNCCCIL